MSVDATIRHILGYDGSLKSSLSLQLADESTIVYASGHMLLFTCTLTGRQHILVRSRKLVTFDCNWKTSTFVIATRESNGPIWLYSYPDKKLIRQFKSQDDQQFEYSLIKFSYCGRRLLSIRPASPFGNDPERSRYSILCVWDVGTLAPEPGCEHARVCGSPRFASFDPANNNMFVIGGDHGLEIWKVYVGRTTALNLLRPKKVDLSTRVRECSSNVDLDEKRTQLFCHAWLPHSRLLVADQVGDMLLVDATKVRVVHVVRSATRLDRCSIVGIVGTTKTVMVAYADGAIAWLQMGSWELIHTGTLSSGSFVTAIATTPSYAKAFVGTQNCKIFEICTSVSQDNEDRHGINMDAGVLPGNARIRPKRATDTSAYILPCASFTTGPICDSTILTPFGGSCSTDALIVTGGVNGILALWNLRDCHQAAEVNVAELFAKDLATSGDENSLPATASTDLPRIPRPSVMITKLASCRGDPIIMVGDHQGRLRSLYIAKVVGGDGVEVRPQHLMQLLPPHAPLDIVALHPTHSVLLVASTHSGQALLLSMDHEKRFPVQAFFTFQDPDERVVDIQWNCTAGGALTLTCLSSRGLFYGARYEVPSQEIYSVSGALELHPNVIASGQATLFTCTKLQFLANSSSSVMIAASTHHPDLMLLKYRDGLLGSKDDTSILSRVLIKQAHTCGISAVALFPRVLRNNVELLVTGGMDGSLTFWTLNTVSTRRHITLPCALAAHPFDELEAVQATTLVTHNGPVTALRFVLTNEGKSSVRKDLANIQLISTGVDSCAVFLTVRLSADLLDESIDLSGAQNLDSMMNPLYMNVVAATKYDDAYQPKRKQEQMPFLEARTCAETMIAHDRFDHSKESTRLKLRELKEQLEGLLAENEQLSQSEQLAPNEFVLNIAWRDSLLKQHAVGAEQVRKEITRDVARTTIVRERMKREFWDEAEVRGVRLNALSPPGAQQPPQGAGKSAPFFVNNFPMRRHSLSEQKIAKQIAFLRRVEFAHLKDKDSESHYSTRFQYAIPRDLQWVLNAALLHPKVQLGTTASKSAEDYSRWPSFKLFYHPAAVRTWKQARVQIHLVRCHARDLQRAYNSEFLDLVDKKTTAIEQIETKNARMVAIMTELHVNADARDLFQPQWAPEEKDQSIINVLPEELTQNEYNSIETRKQHDREARDVDKRKKGCENDNGCGRALMDMMDGTLEVRNDPLKAPELVKEPWMLTIPPDEMTVDQKKRVLHFEAAQAKFEDKRDKHRQSLELELQKTRADVMELCRTFDDKLRALRERYVATQFAVLSQELYELQLGEELRRREQLELEIKRLEDEARVLHEAEVGAQAECDQFAAQLEACRGDFHRALEEERGLDKNFGRDLEMMIQNGGNAAEVPTARPSQLDSPEFMKRIVELYRKRKPGDFIAVASDQDGTTWKTSSARSKGSAKQRLLAEGHIGEIGSSSTTSKMRSAKADTLSAHANLNPFQQLTTDQCSPSRREGLETTSPTLVVVPLDYATDRPVGVLIEDRIWRALNALRTNKIIAENAVRVKSDALAHAKTGNDELHLHLVGLQRRRKEQQRERKTMTQRLTALTESAPLLVCMKQGQDECPFGARDDALLVSRTSVEALNNTIQVHGNDQVRILGRLKDFRKSINVMEWEHTLLELQTRDMDERYTDIQLLRVTKDLQELFHTRDTSHKQKRQAAMLKAKLTHLSKHHEIRMLKLERTGCHFERKLREQERENNDLQQQVTQLATQVQTRENVLASRISATMGQQVAGGGARRGATRLKAIAVRCKLADLAKAQKDEIECMRLELDKMKRRTFPIFALARNVD